MPISLPSASSTVLDLEQAVRASPGLSEACIGRTMRFIASGRLLSDAGATLSSYRVAPGATVHLVLAEGERRGGAGGRAAAALAAAGIGGGGASGGGVPALAPPSPPLGAGGEAFAAAPSRGFDRLSALGLDGEEISLMRLLYTRDVERDFPAAALPPLRGETEALRQLRAEEAWMAVQHPWSSEFAANLRPLVLAFQRRGGGAGLGGQREGEEEGEEEGEGAAARAPPPEGNLCSFLGGVAMGALCGPLTLCWLCTATSTRFKRGVIAGVMVNFILSASGVFDQAQERPEGEKGAAGAGRAGGGFVPMEPEGLIPVGPGSLSLRGGSR